ncbi:choice-of-anchor G family protein [Paenarthrobacter sp. JL.01a]|uniref:PVV-CTERM domain-containing choice-of-anchor G protein n=1 Tax=Paenarthrobacter sp. JL.01a TaxID=2979324 RepID=UPI0021CA8D0C|nr:choice-of-anchor G family protein [Paenarthrobacter sp. JL.01a]UXM92729.1 choice-of-anchor G family protein [Paenarthrobacter sp. JL.01a]
MNSKSKLWPTAVGVTAVSALAIGLVAAPAANAAPTDVISVGSGQIIDGSVLTLPNFASLASNGAATAQQIGTPPSGPAVIENDTPLDLSAVFGVVNVGAGNIPLLQNNGIIQVGAVSQYGKAVNDGSSEAFSGTVSGAPGLVTLPGGLPTNGDPSIPAARINVGTAGILGGTDLVNVNLQVATLAAAAKKDQGAAAQGAYSVAGVSAEVGGTVIGGVAGTISTAINTANAVLTPLGVTVANPVAGGTISITEADLLAVAGVADLNSLPAGTDLISFLPQAVANKLTSVVSSTLATATTAVNGLGPIAQIVAGPALAALTTTLNGVTGALATSIVAPLSTALTALVSAKVNVQETAPSGAFTQRALQVAVAGGSIATVNLANATVGPNLDAAAIPLVNTDTMAITGGVALLALLGWLFVRSRRRTAVAAA